MEITRISDFTGVVRSMELDITQEQVDLYKEGETAIQDVFPNLTPDQREFFKTGITPEEWDDAFWEEY